MTTSNDINFTAIRKANNNNDAKILAEAAVLKKYKSKLLYNDINYISLQLQTLEVNLGKRIFSLGYIFHLYTT